MKKISFGSFPLTEIKAEDRKCLDRYLIKTFSDNISISDAIRNLSITKNLMYITPDNLMKDWLGTPKSDNVRKSDRTSASTYDQALKRAFYVLKEFYKKIKDAPFYKEFIYYPIYVEKIEKIDIGGSSENNTEFTETKMNYSFVILSNDLTKSLKIDEIRYDENASLNFLFLFIEFFSGEKFGRSIHDFNKKDYEFLVKLYQFIEHSGKDPIHMTLTLYKLLGLVQDAASGNALGKRQFGANIDKTMDNIDASSLVKYRGMIKHRLLDLMYKDITSEAQAEAYRLAFIDIMESVFKSEGLNGLYDGVDPSADMGERHTYIYNTNKYREILNLAKELVDYNSINCDKVITKDPMDFDFKVEHGEYTIETQSQIVAQKYQTFFKAYVDSISNHLQGLVTMVMEGLKVEDTVKTKTQAAIATGESEFKSIEKDIKKYTDGISSIEALNMQHRRSADAAAASGDQPGQQRYEDEIRRGDQAILTAKTKINQLNSELDQRRLMNATIGAAAQKTTQLMQTAGNTVYKEIKDNILSSLANDLTFVYDDGKSFFSNDLVTRGFLDLTEKSGLNPLTPTGFAKIAKDANVTGVFPHEIGPNKDPNPEYMAAQVIKGLQDGFDAMATDTVTSLGDSILPALRRVLGQANVSLAKSFTSDLGSNKFFKGAPTEEKVAHDILKELLNKLDNAAIPKDIEKALKTTIYRNRFIEYVLKNFKKLFKVKHVEKTLAFDQSVSQLHPLIRKLVSKGKGCQFFKSFIINFDTCEQLYNLKFLVDNQKFLYGLTQKPPRKLGNPMNRIQSVLFDYLGLKDNPVWILSKTNVYMSMPDDLSLTNTSILSNIPKQELMQVCKIKASDYWNEQTMGRVSKFGSKEIKKLNDRIEAIRKEISNLQGKSKDSNDKHNKDKKADGTTQVATPKSNKGKNIEAQIATKYKEIERLEEKISKIRQDEKSFRPNAFIFNDEDDANKAENTPLLTDAEKDELNKKKEEMRDKLLELNPYDEEELVAMEDNVKNQTQRSHPFDFEEDKGATPQEEEKELTALETLLKDRERWHDKGK